MVQKSFSGGAFEAPQTNYTPMAQGQRCYHSHPKLIINGGTFIGGSCISPVELNADVYIGFDYGMSVHKHKPWDGDKEPIQVYFPIQDRGVPENIEVFRKLVYWAADRLKEGKIVHAGCIGGHGRTGLFLAALYKTVTGYEDAVTKVRELYCWKAVESQAQVKWLHEHFGITLVAGTDHAPRAGTTTGRASSSGAVSYGTPPKPLPHTWPTATGGKEFKSQKSTIVPPQQQAFKGASEVYRADPKSTRSIWGVLV